MGKFDNFVETASKVIVEHSDGVAFVYIRDGEIHELKEVMKESVQLGMKTSDQSLSGVVLAAYNYDATGNRTSATINGGGFNFEVPRDRG